MEFLEFFATRKGLNMDPKKVEAVVSWEVPKKVKNVKRFLGFANFYRIFIKNYSQVAALLTWLTCKTKLERGPLAEKAFQDLKKAFTTAPIFIHPNSAKGFYLEADASNFVLGAVLLQMGVDEKLHPIAFYSQKFLLQRLTMRSTTKYCLL